MDYFLIQPKHSFFYFQALNINDNIYIFESIVITVTTFIIGFITGKAGLSISVVSMLSLILSYASSIKYALRHELFRLDDLRITEAAGLAFHSLDFNLSSKQTATACGFLFFIISGIILCFIHKKISYKEHNNKIQELMKRLGMATVLFIIMLIYILSYIKTVGKSQIIDGSGISDTGHVQYLLYEFLKDDKYNGSYNENPKAGYEYFLSDNIQTNISHENPNIIIIMNESWWNTDNIKGGHIAFSLDPMEAYKRLAPDCSTGYLSTNIYGGGTVSSELECLTGLNTKYFMSDTGIHIKFRQRKMPSLVDYFHALDYQTTFIHPYYGNMYDRDKIYPKLGFDKIIFEDSMDYTDIYSVFISDESLSKQIIKEYEDETCSRKFIFAVSVANHTMAMEYKIKPNNNYPYPIDITMDKDYVSESDYNELVNCINGIYLAGKAFAQLVDYFENIDEPVVIIMYGDHFPFMTYNSLRALGLDDNDYDTTKRQYSVPVIMWSNFNNKKVEFTGENINYLPQIILEYASLPESDMTQILKYEKEILKTNTRYLVEDNNGNPLKIYNDIQTEAVQNYKIVDYDILFGNSTYREKVWQPHKQ